MLQDIMKNLYIYPKVLESKKKFADNSIKILKISIREKMKELEKNVVDYSNWDTAYDLFINDDEYLDRFIEDNFLGSTFKILDIDYIGIYDMDNNFVWNGFMRNGIIKDDEEVVKMGDLKLIDFFDKNKKAFSGIYKINNTNYFFSISPITKTDLSGEPRGYMVFAKKIDFDYISELGKKNNMKIGYIMNTRWNTKYFNSILDKIKISDGDCKYYYDEKENHYIYFDNMFGDPVFILRLNFYEGITTKDISVAQERYISILLAFILMLILYNISRKKVVKPLEDLSDHIKKIIYSGRYEEIKRQKSTIEVEELVNSFNKLIKKINIQNKQIESINDYLTELSYIDPLTKLYNRRMFEEKFEELLISAKRSNVKISLILSDIDYFKNYNDFYGHIMGDKSLIEVANTLKESFDKEKEEYVFRYGGEEFVMLLYNKNLDEAEEKVVEIQERIRKMKLEHLKSEVSGHITISSGFISFDFEEFTTINAAVDRADKALYKAKEKGRDRYERLE